MITAKSKSFNATLRQHIFILLYDLLCLTKLLEFSLSYNCTDIWLYWCKIAKVRIRSSQLMFAYNCTQISLYTDFIVHRFHCTQISLYTDFFVLIYHTANTSRVINSVWQDSTTWGSKGGTYRIVSISYWKRSIIWGCRSGEQ